ncbi:MAG: ATP-binding protein [Lachnospiraceae bacterium]|nr:ATP-binding protein [Lachnospiraceae bacterium]
MIDKISKFINNNTYSVATRNLAVIHAIFIAGLSFMTGIIYYCIEDPFYTYLTVILIFLFFVSAFDALRSGRVRHVAMIMSIVFNLVYLPLCFVGFGRLICVVPFYFILGLLYTGMLVDGKRGMLLSFIQIVVMAGVIAIYGNGMHLTEPGSESLIEMIAIIFALVISGVLSALAVKYRAERYSIENETLENMHLKVIDAYNQKDIFLANTSHEIRTPLNAIVGTVNLLLDEDLDSRIRENVYSILNSCNALLSITDELMDLSNTENQSIEISSRRYDLSELLSVIINMMAVRLMETDINLYVEIDKDIPRYLFGDSTKIRQLFINILNNAVKYTKQGHITLRVKGKLKDKGHVTIMTEVEDTGIGIKAENLPKLFDIYNRDDDEEKRTIEGNGIGINLCRDILDKMGGSISVKSEYHVGTTFFFSFTQQIDSFEKLVTIKNPEDYKVLIFERNEELSKNIHAILKDLEIRSDIALNRMEFETYILSGRYNYIFISAEKYTENSRFIERKIKDERVVVLTDMSQSITFANNGYILTRPIYATNIAMALQNESNEFAREVIKKGGFICPDTKIMVVDDNLTNLEVASGILQKYEATIYTALSGAECLNMLKTTDVDIIFLDYMMPEMNGIDTLYFIRDMDNDKLKEIPVVALTANVVNGAREMFMDAGFDEYIAKPININKIEQILKKLLPREQIILKNSDD